VKENKALREYLDPEKEITGGRRIMHKRKFCNLCFTYNVVRVIKSGGIRLVGHGVRMGK
jgi:hypothetical protein